MVKKIGDVKEFVEVVDGNEMKVKARLAAVYNYDEKGKVVRQVLF